MKPSTVITLLLLLCAGCAAPPEIAEPPASETPIISARDRQAAQDEARWLAAYNGTMKDVEPKMIPKKFQPADIEAARAVAEKNRAALDAVIIPPVYSKVHRVLLKAFHNLRDGHLCLEMGIHAKDTSLLNTGKQKLRTASKSFNEARTLMKEVTARKEAKEKRAAAQAARGRKD